MRIISRLILAALLAAWVAPPAAFAQFGHPEIPKQPGKDKSAAKAAPTKGKARAKTAVAPPPPPTMALTAGTGPLVLTSSAAVAYQEYFAHACPLVLAVEAAGWNAYGAFGPADHCPSGKDAITPTMVRSALKACSSFADNPPCMAIAIGATVVWDGPITFLPSRYTPQGENQFSILLRKIPREGEIASSYDTTAGLVTYADDGRSADIQLLRDHDLGVCRGSLTRPEGAPTAVALTCTMAGAVAGTITLDTDGHTGTGAATGDGQRQFALTVLPHADFLASRMIRAAPTPESAPAAAPSAEATKPATNRPAS